MIGGESKQRRGISSQRPKIIPTTAFIISSGSVDMRLDNPEWQREFARGKSDYMAGRHYQRLECGGWRSGWKQQHAIIVSNRAAISAQRDRQMLERMVAKQRPQTVMIDAPQTRGYRETRIDPTMKRRMMGGGRFVR